MIYSKKSGFWKENREIKNESGILQFRLLYLQNRRHPRILKWDIIGFDIDGFHSFLCNSLQKEFENISFSENGLIDLDFLTVKEMCKKLAEEKDEIILRKNKNT